MTGYWKIKQGGNRRKGMKDRKGIENGMKQFMNAAIYRIVRREMRKYKKLQQLYYTLYLISHIT